VWLSPFECTLSIEPMRGLSCPLIASAGMDEIARAALFFGWVFFSFLDRPDEANALDCPSDDMALQPSSSFLSSRRLYPALRVASPFAGILTCPTFLPSLHGRAVDDCAAPPYLFAFSFLRIRTFDRSFPPLSPFFRQSRIFSQPRFPLRRDLAGEKSPSRTLFLFLLFSLRRALRDMMARIRRGADFAGSFLTRW